MSVPRYFRDRPSQSRADHGQTFRNPVSIHSETTLPSQLRRAFRFFLACPPYRPGDVLRHANAFVCLPHGDTLPHPGPCTPRLAPAMRSTITTTPFQFATALPVIDSATNCRSNPIAHRVRRKHQRLPPSLLIENASDSRSRSRPKSARGASDQG